MFPHTQSSLFSSVNGIKPQIVKKVCEKRTFTAQFFDGPGPLIICLHGFPDTINTFRSLVPSLVNSGYRVLVPVMPGYESSSISDKNHYFITDLCQELVGWIDYLGEEKVHVIGHDWGAVTGWMAVSMFPDRFFSFTSIAIPSLKHFGKSLLHCPTQVFKSWYMAFIQLRGLAEWAVGRKQGKFIRRLWQSWSPGWQCPDDLLASAVDIVRDPNTRHAVLGYYRCLFNPLSHENKRGRDALQGPIKVPCLMITGSKDGCMDTRLFEPAMSDDDFPKGVELYRVMGAGHFCHLEKAGLVNAKILSFMELHPKGAKKLADELARQLG